MAHIAENSEASQNSALVADIQLAHAAVTVLADEAINLALSSEDESSSEEEGEDVDEEDEDFSDGDEDEDDDHHDLPPSRTISPSESIQFEVLRHTLSTYSANSTSSSFAERMEKAKRLDGTPLRVIGRGTCGTVFEIPGTEVAYKKGVDSAALWNDANLTNVACKAIIESKTYLEAMFPDISVPRVPKVFGWVSNDNLESWWDKNQSRFPEQDNERGNLFQVQRILPLPSNSREALIRNYFPEGMQSEALQDPSNKACLVRPYLGKRRSYREFNCPETSLLNFPLYMDQLEEIGLNIHQYAKEMAVGLAIVHWKASLDGMDMEFVIGSATMDADLPAIVENFQDIQPFSVPAGDFKRRQTHLWMLDYDKAKKLNFKHWKTTCEQMVTAVTANDPYFPNPASIHNNDQGTWTEFETAYLAAAGHILKLQKNLTKKDKKWPGLFIKEWKKRAEEIEKDADGNFIEFGE